MSFPFESERREFETFMQASLSELNCPDVLKEPMLYSLNVGGKRIRPILFLLTAAACSGSNEKCGAVKDFSLAIEFIHTYSLIHDDLPCMDNDDFRRGKPSCHKVFGEAMATLAGDALLNYAHELLLKNCNCPNAVAAARLVSKAASVEGMLGGQAQDVAFEKGGLKDVNPYQLLNDIHLAKTASLITVCLTSAATLCGASNTVSLLTDYGNAVGMLFQIVDDILDLNGNAALVGKTLGKDVNKLTFPNVYGEEQAREFAEGFYSKADSIAAELVSINPKFSFLTTFANFIFIRNY